MKSRPPPMDLPPLDVLRTLHAGESEVLLARDAAGELRVLKRLAPRAAHREDLARRLNAEGDFLRVLNGEHHVLRWYATLADPPALVLEYAGGGTLAERLSSPVPVSDALEIFASLLRAVGHCHARGVIHRDIKPSNVLFTADGEVRLADFGVAARAGTAGPLAPDWEEERVGTLPYAAPEQLRDPVAGIHPAADVYSLGVVLFEMLTGRLPFELLPGEDESGLRERMQREDPTPPRALAQPRVTPEMEGVLLRALERDPERRIGSAAELRAAVTDAAGNEVGSPRGRLFPGR